MTNRYKCGIFKTDIIPSSIIGNDYQSRQEDFHESVQSHADEYGYDEQHVHDDVLCIRMGKKLNVSFICMDCD